MSEYIILTHRGTNENIKNKIQTKCIPANYPIINNWFIRNLLEHKNKAVWVSVGNPNWWNKIWSGMMGERGEAYIVFHYDKQKVISPSGLKKIFGKSQKIIEEDIILNDEIVEFYKFKSIVELEAL